MATFPVNQPVGVRVYGPATFADNISEVDVRVTNWPQASRTLKIDVEVSFDGGASWEYAGGMNATPGARPVGRDGTTDASFVIGPMPLAPARQARITATVAGGTVSASMTIKTA